MDTVKLHRVGLGEDGMKRGTDPEENGGFRGKEVICSIWKLMQNDFCVCVMLFKERFCAIIPGDHCCPTFPYITIQKFVFGKIFFYCFWKKFLMLTKSAFI